VLDREDIARVVRTLDSSTMSGTSVESILARLDCEPSAPAYVAEQRALRVALIWEGWTLSELEAMADRMQPRRVKLDTMAPFLSSFAGLWLDGFVAGLKAKEDQLSE
jgi:hypothetical protein